MLVSIQIVENSDRFHVSESGTPIYTILHGNGISKPYAKMQAESEAFKLVLLRQSEGKKVRLLHTLKYCPVS